HFSGVPKQGLQATCSPRTTYLSTVTMAAIAPQQKLTLSDDDPMTASNDTLHQHPAVTHPAHPDVDAAWATVIRIVDSFSTSLDKDEPFKHTSITAEDLAAHISTLRLDTGGGLLDVLGGYVLSVLDRSVAKTIAPHFWSLLSNNEKISAPAPSDVESGSEPTSATGTPQRQKLRAYGRVERALLYVDEAVKCHLALVRLLDRAFVLSAVQHTVTPTPTAGGGAQAAAATAANSTIEARYRSAFTAQVMAGAKGDFHGTMRA
ncbi:unnamed protein product, partial [Sphacelaria rigidula]